MLKRKYYKVGGAGPAEAGSASNLLFVKPSEIRFTQYSIAKNFSDGLPLQTVVEQLINDETALAAIPNIRIVKYAGSFYTLDNRRLHVFQCAQIKKIPAIVCSLAVPNIKEEFWQKKTSHTQEGGGHVRDSDAGSSTEVNPFEDGSYDFIKRILRLPLKQLQSEHEQANLEKLPARWFSQQAYYNAFIPFILEEARATLAAGLAKINKKEVSSVFDMVLTSFRPAKNTENPSGMVFEKRNLQKDWIQSGDVLLLAHKTEEDLRMLAMALGKREDASVEEQTKVTVKAILHEEFVGLHPTIFLGAPTSQWHAYPLGSVITLQRMYQVCLRKPTLYKNMHIPVSWLESLDLQVAISVAEKAAKKRAIKKSIEQFMADCSGEPMEGASSEEEVEEAALPVEIPVLTDAATKTPFFRIDTTAAKEILDSSGLNASQLLAIESFALSEPEHIQFVQGPPGTGKTTFIKGLLRILLATTDIRIVISGPSNKAVQWIAEQLLPFSHDFSLLLVGVKDKLPEHSGLKNIFFYTFIDEVKGQLSILLNRLHQLATEPRLGIERFNSVIETLCAIKSALRCYGLNDFLSCNAIPLKLVSHARSKLSDKQVLSQCLNVSLTLMGELTQHKSRIEKALVKKSRIIFATLSTLGSSLFKELAPPDVLIVDEAGQATEPEGLIGLGLGAKRVVFVGDIQQLPPTVISPEAEKNGFGRSMLERLVKDCGEPYKLLDKQYRMAPDISLWPNLAFYDGKIKNASLVGKRSFPVFPNVFSGYTFVNTAGRESSQQFTFTNQLEASHILETARYLLKKAISAKDIGIISFYRGQILLIKQLILKSPALHDVTVNTVDAFQGGEKKVILISCVRSNESKNIGFLKDPKRINVAVTRAQSLLMVFGNAGTLVRSSPVWQSLIENAKERNRLFDDKIILSHYDLKGKSAAAPKPSYKGKCRFFNGSARSCRKGDACPFSHALKR